MNYSISLLSSREDCQTLIDICKTEKETMDHKRVGLELQRKSATNTSVSVEADLASVMAEISAYETVLANLPDGPVKDENENKLVKSKYKKFILEQRKENYGLLSVLQKEFDIACLEKDLAEADAFIALLEAQMMTL